MCCRHLFLTRTMSDDLYSTLTYRMGMLSRATGCCGATNPCSVARSWTGRKHCKDESVPEPGVAKDNRWSMTVTTNLSNGGKKNWRAEETAAEGIWHGGSTDSTEIIEGTPRWTFSIIITDGPYRLIYLTLPYRNHQSIKIMIPFVTKRTMGPRRRRNGAYPQRWDSLGHRPVFNVPSQRSALNDGPYRLTYRMIWRHSATRRSPRWSVWSCTSHLSWDMIWCSTTLRERE